MPDWAAKLWYEANFWSAWTGYTLGWSFRSDGSRNMPRTGPVLIVANHESFLDPVAVGLAVRRKVRYLARKTLFSNKLFGKYLHSVGCVPVDQDGVAKEGLKTSLEVLHAGHPLLIFPEGERTLTGQMLPFKPGILLLMKKAPVPILPVGVAGAFEAYPRKAPVPKFSPLFWSPTGYSISTSVGKPVPPERFAGMSREQTLQTLFDLVKVQVDQAERILRR